MTFHFNKIVGLEERIKVVEKGMGI